MARARRVRPNRVEQAKALAPIGGGFLGAIATWWLISGNERPILALGAFVATLLSFIAGAGRFGRNLRENPSPHIEEVACSGNDDAIRIGDQRISRSKIRSASVVQLNDEAEIDIILDTAFAPRIQLRAESVADGEELLDELGLSVSQQTATFHAGAPLRTRHTMMVLAAMMLFIVAGMSFVPGAYAPLVAVALVLPLLAIILPQEVVVGADGLYIKWALRKRFVPHEHIADVTEDTSFGERVYAIELHGGERLLLPVGSSRAPKHQLDSLKTRIDAARRHHAGGELAEATALLARGDADHAEWLQRLRAIEDVGQHRKTAIVDDTLWQILESPVSPPVARAAAAVALRPRLDNRARLRIHEIARSTASTRLRVALEADDDEALAEAIIALETDEPTQHA